MFQDFLLTPLFNALIFLYNTIGLKDLGLAIILLTALIRTIFLPLFYKSTKNQILLQKLQPEIQKIQHNHKDNKEKQAQAIMDLYKTHDVNPFSGILMLLIQLPVLIAIYHVFLKGFGPETFEHLYSFIEKPERINAIFLGLIDLEKRSIVMVSLAAIAQGLQSYLMFPKTKKGQELSAPEKMGRQMAYISPIFTVLILFNLPGAIGLYWLVTSVYSAIQQIYINKTLDLKEEKKEHHLK